VLVHALGVTGRGQFAATTSPTLLLALAGTLGLPEAATYFVASGRLPARTTARRVCLQSAAIGLVLAAVVALAAPIVAGHDPRVTAVMTWGAFTLPAALVVGAVRGVAAGRHRWTLVNLERGGGNLLRLGLVVGLAAAGQLHLASATLVYLLCPVLAGAVYVPLLMSLRREPATPLSHGQPPSALLRYGLHNWIGGLAGIVLARLDQVLMTPLSDSRQLGLYAAAVAIAEIPYVVSGATRDVILASDAARADDARALQASRLTFLATFAFAAALAAISPLLISIAYGTAFSGATPMLVLLLVASVAYAPGMTSGGLLLSRGRPALRSLSLAGACVINVLLLPILVPALGGVGAALASVAAYLAFSAANLVLLRRLSSFTIREMLVPRRGDGAWIAARWRAVRG
jgi:O-antigen/teichoic acid export membrane protein